MIMKEKDQNPTLTIGADKDGHTYIWTFHLDQKNRLHREFGKTAANPDLSFDFRDAFEMTRNLDVICKTWKEYLKT